MNWGGGFECFSTRCPIPCFQIKLSLGKHYPGVVDGTKDGCSVCLQALEASGWTVVDLCCIRVHLSVFPDFG